MFSHQPFTWYISKICTCLNHFFETRIFLLLFLNLPICYACYENNWFMLNNATAICLLSAHCSTISAFSLKIGVQWSVHLFQQHSCNVLFQYYFVSFTNFHGGGGGYMFLWQKHPSSSHVLFLGTMMHFFLEIFRWLVIILICFGQSSNSWMFEMADSVVDKVMLLLKIVLKCNLIVIWFLKLAVFPKINWLP